MCRLSSENEHLQTVVDLIVLTEADVVAAVNLLVSKYTNTADAKEYWACPKKQSKEGARMGALYNRTCPADVRNANQAFSPVRINEELNQDGKNASKVNLSRRNAVSFLAVVPMIIGCKRTPKSSAVRMFETLYFEN